MANEKVKFNNELNTVVMRRWTSEEINLFFAVIAKAREKGTSMLNMSTHDLKEIVNYKSTSKKRWDDTIKGAVNKMASLYYYEDNEQVYKVILLFSEFEYNKETESLNIQLNEKYSYILNNITANFTIFELKEFIELKSTYSKTMYRLLKQWRTVGRKVFKKEDLFMLLDVPESTQKTKNFNPRVLDPILEELSPIFKGLKIDTVRARTTGRPIQEYVFTWKKETVGIWDDDKYIKKDESDKYDEIVIPIDYDFFHNSNT